MSIPLLQAVPLDGERAAEVPGPTVGDRDVLVRVGAATLEAMAHVEEGRTKAGKIVVSSIPDND